MASAMSTRTTLNDIVYSLYIEPLIGIYAFDAGPIQKFCRVANIANTGSLVCYFPRWDLDTAAAVTEGSDATLDDLTTSTQSITASMTGVYREISELVANTAIISKSELEQFIARDGGTLIGLAKENSLAGQFSSFSNSVGTSGDDCTAANILEAQATLRNYNARGPIVAVLDKQQASDLSLSVASTNAAVFGNPSAGAADIFRGASDGYLGMVFGTPVYYSTLTDTANGGADVVGAMFVDGAASPQTGALGIASAWDARLMYNADAQSVSNHYTIHSVYGVGIINDTPGGVQIVTDA